MTWRGMTCQVPVPLAEPTTCRCIWQVSQSLAYGIFHSAEGVTFVSDTGGTFIPILSTYTLRSVRCRQHTFFVRKYTKLSLYFQTKNEKNQIIYKFRCIGTDSPILSRCLFTNKADQIISGRLHLSLSRLGRGLSKLSYPLDAHTVLSGEVLTRKCIIDISWSISLDM